MNVETPQSFGNPATVKNLQHFLHSNGVFFVLYRAEATHKKYSTCCIKYSISEKYSTKIQHLQLAEAHNFDRVSCCVRVGRIFIKLDNLTTGSLSVRWIVCCRL